MDKRPLTKRRFESLLKKTAQPLESDLKGTQTKRSHHSGGCSGKRIVNF